VLSGLAGKVAVVTGGAGGIGSAPARRLSAEGVAGYLDGATRTFRKTDFHHLNAGIPGAGARDFEALDARTHGGEG